MLTTTERMCVKCNKTFEVLESYKHVNNICLDCQGYFDKSKPMEIVIRPELLDLSALEGVKKESHFWRPDNWDCYIGQNKLKSILQSYLQGTKEMNKTFPHVLINGKAGTGKTTIIYLLSKYLNVPFVECVANTIQSPQQLIDKLIEVKGGILFLDEIHTINSKVANFILPILEDFSVCGQRIMPFTFACATTEPGVLIKKFKPFFDRMKINKELDAYTLKELEILTKQYKEKNFPNKNVDDSVYNKISKNCRGTPRIAIRLLESYIFMKCPIEEIFKVYNIVKDSLTENDIKILNILNEKEKGVGLKALSAYLATSEQNYLYQIEGYLIEQGLITISSRRQITDKGKKTLTELLKG